MSEQQDAHPLPAVALDYIEGVVGQMKCRRGLREEVRRELTGHFEDALQHCGENAEVRAAAVQALIVAFGEGALLAELMRRGKKRCDRGAVSGLIGLGMMGFTVLGCIVLGSPVGIFINIPSIAIALGIPLALGLAAYGRRAMARAFGSVLALLWNPDPDHMGSDTPVVLRGLVSYTYAASAIGTFLGLIQVVSFLSDPSVVGPALAVMLLVPLYGVLLAEGVYRPAAKRVIFLRSLGAETHETKYGIPSNEKGN